MKRWHDQERKCHEKSMNSEIKYTIKRCMSSWFVILINSRCSVLKDWKNVTHVQITAMWCDAIERRQKAVKKEANRKSRKETQGCQCTRLSTNVDSTSYNLWNIIKLYYISWVCTTDDASNYPRSQSSVDVV